MPRRIFAPGLSRATKALVVGTLLLVALALALLARAWAPIPPRPAHATLASAPAPSEPAPTDERTPEIRGHVLDAEGNAVEGATVRLVSASALYTVYREARSDRAGAFSFPRAVPWRLRVVADHAPDGIVTSAVLHTSEGQTTEVTPVLSAAGGVRGTVVDAQGHPVTGAVISVEGVPWIVAAATSDEAGAFRLTNVPGETTSLVAVARGYRTARASGLAKTRRSSSSASCSRARIP